MTFPRWLRDTESVFPSAAPGEEELLFITKFTSPVLLPSATLTGTHLCLLFQPFPFLTPGVCHQ